ncbi:glycosyltransferase [Candidatus Formimonas warabiya]|uniref:Glycosyltransferase n=1 Tax=Formimonas warabiya TaxID=1761012 RepID=A0A3G1KPV5_FORW1|nr:glycosyltransferase [Candidatus Formimonas warabiya]ATW24494.1 hypothetical protein DCMF_06610 [Candidatus Formimonas warabiya]
MKILLLGEFSGFFKNLKEGILELGYEINLVNPGDEYRNTVKTDLYIPSSRNYLIRNIEKLIFPFWKLKQYYNYDIVQLTGHNVFGGLKYNYNYLLIDKIKRNSNKMFMSSCGSDYFFYKKLKCLKYSALEEHIEIDLNGYNPYNQKKFMENNINVVNLVDGIIPTAYSYAEAYREHNRLLNTIQFPINVNKIAFTRQKIENNKIKIFHGITREGFKGTKYIKEAMLKIKEKYPNDVEILIDGKMPLNKYLKVLEETNVVIDQALSYSYGMNALYSMAMGKVVLSGNEPECQQEFGRTDIPIINILPSVDDIFKKLEKLVLDKKCVIEIGQKSRLFVEDFHHHIKVAQKYIDTWNLLR